MIWERLRGMEEPRQRFLRSIERGRLAHAYLFVGPEGVGKKLFAQTLAQCLLCSRFPETELEACGECSGCRQMLAGTHPDFFLVGCPEGKRELPIEAFVGSRERRGHEGLCHDLSLRPMAGRRKIAVVDDANRMTTESANALLKTLEEPPPDSLLILVAATIDGLLPTIRSRCQLVRFPPLRDADVAELLQQLEMVPDAQEAHAVAALCEGSLAVAEQLLDPALRRLREALYDGLAAAEFDSLAIAAQMVEGVDELAADTPGQRRLAGWLLRFALEFYRQAALLLSGHDGTVRIPQVRGFCASLPAEAPDATEAVMRLFDRTTLAVRHLEQNMPVPLCLEGLFDELGQIRRASFAGTSRA